MIVETLREAAARTRCDWAGTTDEDFYFAVADFLDNSADRYLSSAIGSHAATQEALAIARAYLGGEA